ncbi:MAG: DUF4783 domain-containing protein [Bacteroidales bacterium]|nr:DUF4783 domain-containing protein [Bacteroidales bacterium]
MKSKQHILFYLIILNLSLISLIGNAQGVSKQTFEQIFKEQDISKLNSYLNSTIELKTPTKEGSYSKKQTHLILKEYFSKHPVKNFKIQREGTFPDGSVFYLCDMTDTPGQNYRVYFVSKKTSGEWLIHILQIEKS